MQIEAGTFCPLIKEDCIQFKCTFWTHIRGLHPQSGQEIDEWDCAVKWLPLLLIENVKEVRQGAAATESFRNVMLDLNKGISAEVIEAKAELKALSNGS